MSILSKYKQVTDFSGRDWYKQAHEFCVMVSDRYNVPLVTVCAVMSALSPSTNYEQNKRDTVGLISGKRGYKCGTYGQNVIKARMILKTGIPTFSLLTGPKTYNFFFNLLEPDNTAFVTIDRHTFKIATNEPYIGLKGKQYRDIVTKYRKAGQRLGVPPQELQAILWVDYRLKEVNQFKEYSPF